MIVAVIAAALAAADPATPSPEDPAATLKAVQAMYDQSCQVRAYGSYDDLCDALRKQIREAAKARRDASARKPSEPASIAKPPDPQVKPTSAPTAAH